MPKTSLTAIAATKTATIQDVARAAGVTAATVSRTLSGKRHGSEPVRDAVFKAVRDLGYQPNPHAQRLAIGRADKHVDLLSLHLDFGMDARKAQLIQGALQRRGYNAPLHAYGWGAGEVNQDAAPHELVSLLCRQKPRAIVCDLSGLDGAAMEELANFRRQGGIVVGFGYGQGAPKLKCDQVLFDARHSLKLGVQHLAALGHTRIGACFATQRGAATTRLRGFCDLMTEAGLPARPEWVFGGVRRVAETEYEEAGALCAGWFLGLKERPSALCISNDYTALRFVNEMHRAGVSVPEEVSVVGHDDRPLSASAHVPLTSITHPADEIARQVVERLEARFHAAPGADAEAIHVVVRGELRARQSSAAPRSNAV